MSAPTTVTGITDAPRNTPPPGPPGNLLFGVTGEILKDNLRFVLRVARDYGDIARFRLGHMTIYQVNHPDAIKRIFQDNHHNYGKGAFDIGTMKLVIGNGLLMSDGEFWLRQRRLMQPIFHRTYITTFAQLMTATTLEVMGRWGEAVEAGRALDIELEMMRLTLDVATMSLFGTKIREDAAAVGQAFTILMEDVGFRYEAPFYPPVRIPTPRNRRFRAALTYIDGIVHRIIEERRHLLDSGDASQVPDDLLTMLLQVQDEETGERMSDQQLRDEVITLFGAGHESTAKALTWCFYLLSKHPEVERRLVAELDAVLGGRIPTVEDLGRLAYLRMVLDETMRLYPPAWITNRQAIAADTLCGYNIPAGAVIWISPYVMHHHPAYWDNPEGFDPERFTPERAEGRPKFAYFPFGGGPHLCIGKGFALMEAQLVLATILQRYRLALVPGHPVEPLARVTIRSRYGLQMTVHPR